MLDLGFQSPPLPVFIQQLIDLGSEVATTSRNPAFDKVGLFTNQADIEHAQEKDRNNRINKIFLVPRSQRISSHATQHAKARDFAARARIISPWTS